MNRFITAFILMLSGVLAVNADVRPDTIPDGPYVWIPDYVLDFGSFRARDHQEGKIVVHNIGNDTLVIKDISADCGCTVPKFRRDPVAPGDSVEVTVRFNGEGRKSGRFRKVLRIRSNAANSLTSAFVVGNIVKRLNH